MEQATNSFNKGLLMDTHPMVQGNDSLTDCLNGTLITMNGNEVILLNDMGNRRIDNAYLPAGYEPVGMKEYGGIIYVAAYNPITGRGQLGSFPSPERKIGNINTLSGSINFDSFLNGTEVKKDSIITPLTDKTAIHSGDKFTIYSENILSMKEYLSNYDVDVDGNGVYPNRLFTLSVGVLNSQNEFVDITKSLVRWNNTEEESTLYENLSEEEKFNKGYFIASSYNSPTNTGDDNTFIQERLALPINSYSYKLVSPLYLKAQLNHVLDFSYTVYGEKIGNKITLVFETEVYYNCPMDNFKLIFEFENDDYNKSFLQNGNPTYDPNTELYTLKLTYTFEKDYQNSEIIPEEISYIIKVPLIHKNYYINKEEDLLPLDIILPLLTKEGTLEVSKFNSDTIEFDGWKYYNNINDDLNITTFKINIKSYPKRENSNLKSLTLTIKTGTEKLITKTILDEELKTGEIIYDLNWGDDVDTEGETKLKTRELYYIDLECNGINFRENLIFITTKLFNDNYYGYLGSLTANEEGQYEYNYETDQYKYIDDFSKIANIKITPEVDWKYEKDSTSSEAINDKSTSATKMLLIYNIYNSEEFVIKIFNKLFIKNEELYPSNLSLNKSFIENYEIKDWKIQNSEISRRKIESYSEYLYEDDLLNATGNCSVEEVDYAPLMLQCLKDNNQNISYNIDGYYITKNNLKLNIYTNSLIICPSDYNIEKEFIINNVITSFRKFIEDNGLAKINSPWFNLNCKHASDNKYVITQSYTSTNEVATAKGIDVGNLGDPSKITINGHLVESTSVASRLYIIGNVFNNGHENDLFVGDTDDADYIILNSNDPKTLGYFGGDVSSMENYNNSGDYYSEGYNNYRLKFRRIWIRYDENKFTPYLILPFISSTNSFEGDINVILARAWSIPYYYVYNLNLKSTINRYTIDINNCIRSKNFEFLVEVTVSYLEDNIQILQGNTNLFNISNSTIKDDFTMGGFKAKSNDSLEDFITETLQENIIDCALMDNNGNIITGKFDPNYIYRRLPDDSTYVKLSVPKNKKSLGDNLYLPSFPYTNRKIYIKLMDLDLNHKYLDFDGIPYIYSQ